MSSILRLLRRLWRFLKAALAYLSEIPERIFGPPASAIWRVVKRLARFVVRIIEALLNGWNRIWSRNPERAALRRPQHLQSCVALATVLLPVIGYGTPLAKLVGIDSTRYFLLSAVGFWVMTFLVLATWSSSDLETWFTSWLRRMRRTTGLVRWERIGTLLCLVLLFLPGGRTATLPLRVTLLLSFVLMLADEYVPREPRGAAVPIQVPHDDGNSEVTTFGWDVPVGQGAEHVEARVRLDRERYASLRESNPGRHWTGSKPEFAEWVLMATPEIDVLAAQMQQLCLDRGWSSFQEVELVASFAQHFPYSLDIDSRGIEDHWRYPLETLVDGTGDCEDVTILAAAILRRMGHSVAVFYTTDHTALAVEAPLALLDGTSALVDGRRYYYVEMTSAGSRVGELPDAVDPAELRVALIESVQAAA